MEPALQKADVLLEILPYRGTGDEQATASSGWARGSGRTRSAKSARIWASIASVLASWPVALAKSRTWRGLATTTGNPAVASAATKAAS
jgi:hypothetical protein